MGFEVESSSIDEGRAVVRSSAGRKVEGLFGFRRSYRRRRNCRWGRMSLPRNDACRVYMNVCVGMCRNAEEKPDDNDTTGEPKPRWRSDIRIEPFIVVFIVRRALGAVDERDAIAVIT